MYVCNSMWYVGSDRHYWGLVGLIIMTDGRFASLPKGTEQMGILVLVIAADSHRSAERKTLSLEPHSLFQR